MLDFATLLLLRRVEHKSRLSLLVMRRKTNTLMCSWFRLLKSIINLIKANNSFFIPRQTFPADLTNSMSFGVHWERSNPLDIEAWITSQMSSLISSEALTLNSIIPLTIIILSERANSLGAFGSIKLNTTIFLQFVFRVRFSGLLTRLTLCLWKVFKLWGLDISFNPLLITSQTSDTTEVLPTIRGMPHDKTLILFIPNVNFSWH